MSTTATRITVQLAACAACSLSACAWASDLRAVYTEIASSPTSTVPGAKNAAGMPVAAKWVEIFSLAVRTPADDWVMYGRSDLGADLERTLVKGGGTVGSAFLQEGQPLQGGGGAGDVYDSFDGDSNAPQAFPASWNNAGLIGYSARSRNGVNTLERLAQFNGAEHAVVISQGETMTSGTCSGLTYGTQMGSVQMQNDGQVAFAHTSIGGCTDHPILFRGSTASMQAGVTTIGAGAAFAGELIGGTPLWFDRVALTPDGLHYALICGTNNPVLQQDVIVCVDGNAVLREGVASAGITPLTFKRVRLATNNDWYVRGDILGGNDWAIRNGALIAKTGDPIYTGSGELWSVTLNSFVGNASGNWVLHGLTNNRVNTLNTVIVRNGTEVVVRESDPVDVDGNGQYDDDAFIGTIKDDGVWLTDDNVLYLIGTLKDGAGANLGDALVRADLGGANDCPADTNSDQTVNVTDLLAVISAWGPCVSCPPPSCPADINGDCSINVTDLLAIISAWGACP